MEKWIQVSSSAHYDALKYLDPRRMASIGYQFRFIATHFPKAKVLEVGVGAGLSSLILRQMGHSVVTLDVDSRLEPDLLGSVTEIPAESHQYDAFLCCQVLEHLQWSLVDAALAELNRVTTTGGVISVPTNKPLLALVKYGSRGSGQRRVTFGSHRNKPIKDKNGEHHWELESNVTTDDFRKKLAAAGFRVVEEIHPLENLYHHFFVVRKDTPAP